MSPTKRRLLLGAIALILWPASQAQAIMITMSSIAKVAPNTPTAIYYNNSVGGTLLTSGSSERQSSYDSAVSTINAGGSVLDVVNNSVQAKTRYASTQTSDGDGFFVGDAALEAQAHYQISFTVNAPTTVVYDLKIDTQRIGAFVVRQEGASAANSLTAAIGSILAPASALTTLTALPGLNTSSTTVQPFNQTGTNTLFGLVGTGSPQVFTLDFTWNTRTFSSGGISGGDESAILMGLDTRINGDVGAADDYPGTSGRTAANDGHFVTMTATVVAIVPEPSTLALAGLAGVGMVVAGCRNRRKV